MSLASFCIELDLCMTLLKSHILKEFPERASTCVQSKFREEGMIVKTGVSIERLEQTDDETIRVDYLHEGGSQSIETKFLFHALGRAPAVDGLNLAEIGVRIKKSGHIQTNAFQQTSVPHIYCWRLCRSPEIVHIAIQQERLLEPCLGKVRTNFIRSPAWGGLLTLRLHQLGLKRSYDRDRVPFRRISF